MSSTHHPEKACVERENKSLSSRNSKPMQSPSFQNGIMEIGKLNIVLIGLIIVILAALISQEEVPTAPLLNQPVRVQTVTTPEIAALDAQDNAPAAVEQVEPPKTELKAPSKSRKKREATAPAAEYSKPAEFVAGNPSTSAESTPEISHRQEPEHVLQKEPSRNILVFNLWSLSELRLRSTFTKLINDGSAPAAILDTRKKEYLSFVNKRTHKCGELNNKFASNINTVEKLTFKEKDVEILECHTSENTTELNRLNE
ncbi:hypothetical protein ACFQ2T_02725 [Methylophilus flavus]|uniref:Uncharacterized protein n=1 Tax=Methylophilus flavus TaxID=640084 RepID=A0ABW3P8A7_9PROT